MPSTRFLDSLQVIRATDWDALHDGHNPFVSHAFLSGLEEHGCLREDWGWQPQHFTLWDGDVLMGAIPGYLKTNSHGEFVFDHAWANAYARHGRDYYPKWLGAVPYSPVTGPRLLARHDSDRATLLAALCAQLPLLNVSSAHVNFHSASDEALFGDDWLLREDVQFQWQNPGDWATFEQFLGAMDHKHRKNIRQERAKVARQGITFRVLQAVAQFRERDAQTPVALMGYLNPVEIHGYAAFADAAVKAGVDGVLLVDLPPEEAGDAQQAFEAAGLALVLLASPTTSEARADKLMALARGYLYYVSFAGVTGASERLDSDAASARLQALRKRASVPVVAGFGIKDAASAAAMARQADGVVVGSALVAVLAEAGSAEDAAQRAAAFLAPLRQALDA